jgi:hypothetical protein
MKHVWAVAVILAGLLAASLLAGGCGKKKDAEAKSAASSSASAPAQPAAAGQPAGQLKQVDQSKLPKKPGR